MNTVEMIKQMCRERRIPVSRLEKACGFANGYIGQLKKGSIPDDRLKKVADFFGVSVNYFIGEEDGQRQEYYVRDDTAALAQEIFDRPDLRILMDAARGCSSESIMALIPLIQKLKETNPNA